MKDFLKGLEILKKYEMIKGDIDIYAEHYIIYLPWAGDCTDEKDTKTLEKLLGWHKDEQYNCWAFFT